MKVITELNTGIILDIADDAEETDQGIRVTKNGGAYYFGYTVDIHDVEDVPSGVKPLSHIYNGTDFGENPDYTAPYSAEVEVTKLQSQVDALTLEILQLKGLV